MTLSQGTMEQAEADIPTHRLQVAIPTQNRFSPLVENSVTPCTMKQLLKMVQDRTIISRRFKRFVVSFRCGDCLYQLKKIQKHQCSADIILVKATNERLCGFETIQCRLNPVLYVWRLEEDMSHSVQSPSLNIVLELQKAHLKSIEEPFSRVVIWDATSQCSKVPHQIPRPMAALESSLSDNFHFRLGCRACARVRDHFYMCSLEEHDPPSTCPRSNLFARSTAAGDWYWIRRPPTGKRKFFTLCGSGEEDYKFCLYGKKCSHPHNALEKQLWEDERNTTLSFSVEGKVLQLRSSKDRRLDHSIFDAWCSEGERFFFACPRCREEGSLTAEMKDVVCPTHNVPTVLMYGNTESSNPPLTIRFRSSVEDNEASLVEEDVWELIDDCDIPRAQLVKEVSVDSAPQDQANTSIQEEDLFVKFPFPLQQVCQTCLHRSSKRIKQSADKEWCSNKQERHKWVNPAYISVKDGQLVQRRRNYRTTKVCEIKNCKLEFHPHRQLEANIWKWLINHNTTLDEAYLGAHTARFDGPVTSRESTYRAQHSSSSSEVQRNVKKSTSVAKSAISVENWRKAFERINPKIAGMYDVRLACDLCVPKLKWMNIEFNERHEHKCQCKIFLMKRKCEKTWTRIRTRPKMEKHFQFELCKHMNKKNCTNPSCSYPHTLLEMKIWKEEPIQVPTACRRLRQLVSH